MEAGGTRRRGLTVRERQVLTLLARGFTGEEVARELAVSAETVRAHVRNAVTKLHARTRLHAVVMAVQSGEIEPYARDAPASAASEQDRERDRKGDLTNT
jgi:DNA-binding NarL/FixJ family response regulator